MNQCTTFSLRCLIRIMRRTLTTLLRRRKYKQEKPNLGDSAMETELKAAEAEVVKVAEEAKAEVVKVAEEVKAVVVPEVKKAIVAITAEEKLILAEAEVEFLKATMEIQRLSAITAAKGKEYQAAVDAMLVKYGLSKLDYLFDGIRKVFTPVAKKA